MTKAPHAVLLPAGPTPRPGPDLSDSHCLSSGCPEPQGASGQGGVEVYENKVGKLISPKTWKIRGLTLLG